MKLWQSSYSVVSFAEMSRRTVSSDAMEPGAALHASRRSGRRQNVGWFTGPSSWPSHESVSVKLGDRGTGVTERRCARLLIGNTRVRFPAPVLAGLERGKLQNLKLDVLMRSLRRSSPAERPAYIRAAGGSIPSVAISTLSRRWSARLSEAQEDSVRFRGESLWDVGLVAGYEIFTLTSLLKH